MQGSTYCSVPSSFHSIVSLVYLNWSLSRFFSGKKKKDIYFHKLFKFTFWVPQKCMRMPLRMKVAYLQLMLLSICPPFACTFISPASILRISPSILPASLYIFQIHFWSPFFPIIFLSLTYHNFSYFSYPFLYSAIYRVETVCAVWQCFLSFNY